MNYLRKKLEEMSFVLVTQVKNISIVADPYNIKNNENIKINIPIEI